MNDSRSASNRLLRMKRVVEYQSKIIYFLSSILLAMFLTYRLGDPGFTETQNYVLFLLFFSVGLWVTEAVPPFAVGIMIVGFLVFFLGSDYFNTQPESIKPYLNTWSDSVMWLLLGGFFLAEGLKKVGLDVALFKFTLTHFGTKPARLLMGIMLSTAVISMVMSNTATCAMMLATISPLLGQLGKESNYNKSLLLGIAASASLGGMGTIIGSPPNAIAVGSLENIGIKISFIEWMLFGVPVAAALIWLTWRLLCKKYPAEMANVDTGFLMKEKTTNDDGDEITLEEQRVKKRLVLFVLGITAILWLTNNLHGIPVAAVSGIPIILLSMLGIINGDDVRQLPWETLMLVAGGLSLGLAIKETGLAAYFIQKLQYLNLNFFLLLIAFALVTVTLSNVMSNTAAATILTPVAAILAPENPVVLPLVIGFCASCAFFLPVSTPPSAIVFSTGHLRQADFRPTGLLIGLAGPVIIILWVVAVNFLKT
jgi:sodium-dependent dicarboxylate transporter 2/3/5